MNENNTMQNATSDDDFAGINDFLYTYRESLNESKIIREKYEEKFRLIKSAEDMTTPEKLDALDKNFEQKNKEDYQNRQKLYVATAFCIIITLLCSNKSALKTVQKLIVA